MQRFLLKHSNANHIDDVIQETWLRKLLPNMGEFDGRGDFAKYACATALWVSKNFERTFSHRGRYSSLDDKRVATEPSFIDTSFEEREGYERFYSAWRSLSKPDQALFLGATTWKRGIAIRHNDHLASVVNKLRSAVVQAA
jgi:DNA-directed RNA polymerase specialized sigma24 family protein